MKRAVAILLSLLASAPLWAASPEVRQVIQLRQQRQFDAAEKEAGQRLSQPSLSDEARLDLTLELSRTWAEHSLASPAEQQTERWSQAQKVLDDFVARAPRHPKLLLVRAQGALVELARAQRAREDAELAADNATTIKTARDALRGAVARARKLHGEIETQLHAAAPDGKRRAGMLTLAELQSLELNLRLHWARGLREQALSYSATSADRINSLSQALEVLKPLGNLEPTTLFAWSARLDEIGCLRMIDDAAAADHKLQALAKAAPPSELQGRLRAERTRVALARGQWDEALAEAAPGAPRAQSDWTEADLALLETYLILWAQAEQRRQRARGAEWERAAADQVDSIAREHGLRTALRADLLLASFLANREVAPLPATQLRVAEGLERSGKPVEALAAYGRAAERARTEGRAELAFSAELAAAQLEQSQKHFGEAGQRFRALALSAPQHASASEAHLLAVHCAAQQARSQPTPELEEYQRLLVEHLATWPKATTASQARSWLGRLHEQQGDYAAAIEVLSRIESDAPQFAEAVPAIGRSYESWLAALRQQGRPTSAVAAKAVAYFDALVAPDGTSPRTWTPLQRAAAIAEARILLRQSASDAQRVEELVSAALDGQPPTTPDEQHALQALRMTALMAADRVSQAAQAWSQTQLAAGPQSLWLVETLAEIRTSAAVDRKAEIARLELTIVDELFGQAEKFAPATRLDLERRRVVLLAVTGRRSEAVAALTALAGQHPTDGETQEALAQLLGGGDRSSVSLAVDKWREVALKCRPGSPRWWRAHYGLARAQLDLGKPTECLATIKHAEGTPGDFGGPEMKAQFVQLQRQCAQAKSSPARNTK
jgi:hypothetical protein